MNKSIAVLTDNKYLAKEFERIILSVESIEKSNFYVSPYSDITDFDIIGIKTLDIKDEDDAAFIIGNYDLVFSIHSKQMFPPAVVNNVKCINVHPGYNPINRGWYPQVFAIINKTLVGSTIHEMDEELDNGLIIAQRIVEQKSTDTSLSLYNRIVESEIALLEENIQKIIKGDYEGKQASEKGRLFLKKDFNMLKEIDLEKKVTYREAIDTFRALTHGTYSNAYFRDEDNTKVYITIDLKKDQ
jgi:methionyl-tRNA formyltransferase